MNMEADALLQSAIVAEPQEVDPQLFDDPATKILVLCHHAQSRSKMVGRILDDLGYTSVNILGIRDPATTRTDQLELMRQAAIIISTGKDITAETKYYLKDHQHGVIMEVPFTEREHARIVVTQGRDKELKQRVKDRVLQLGFHDVHKKSD